MKKRISLNLVIVLIVGLVLVGCDTGNNPSTGNTENTDENGNNGFTLTEITGFATIADIFGGFTGNPKYTSAEEIIAVLPVTIVANFPGGNIQWPVITWADTDQYTKNRKGKYTFTANLGTAPTGYVNNKNHIATVTVVISSWEWTVIDTTVSNFAPQYRCIDYGNGKWVTGGENGMAWSDDGSTWNVIESMPFTGSGSLPCYVSDISYGNGIWVAVANYGKMAWSDDGITWNSIDTAPTIFGNTYNSGISAVAYGNGKWIVGGGSKIAWSNNGVTWNTENTAVVSSFDSIQSIAYGDGKWMTVGFRKIAWSNDGETWNEVQSPFSFTSETSGAIGGVAYSEGRWIAVTQAGQIAWSDNCTTWNLVDSRTFSILYNISSGDGVWVAVGYGVMDYSLDNGETWFAISGVSSAFGGSCFIMDSVFGNGKCVVVGAIAGSDDSRIAYCDLK